MVELHRPPVLTAPQPRASVRLATWLSAVPGLGQLYNRQPMKALIFLFGVVGLFLVTLNIPGATGELLASHGRLVYCCHIRIQCTSRLMLSLTGWGNSLLTPHAGMIVPLCSSPVLPR